MKILKEDYRNISSANIRGHFSDINTLVSIIKSVVSQNKLIEAVNLTLSKNTDSELFYKVVIENIGLILNTPHIAFILYDPVVEKYSFKNGNGLFFDSTIFKEFDFLGDIKLSSSISGDMAAPFIDLNTEIIKSTGVLVLKSQLNYIGYIIFGYENNKINHQFFEKHHFLILEVSTIFNSHINNRKLKEKIYELNLLNKIITLMENDKESDNYSTILHLFLTHLTAREGLEFNRAIYFKKNPNNFLGEYAVGQISKIEAEQCWNSIGDCPIDLFLAKSAAHENSKLNQTVKKVILNINDDPVICEIISSKHYKIVDINNSLLSPENKTFFKSLNFEKFIMAPLFSYDTFLGIVVVDNAFDNKAFSGERISSLINFTAQTSLVMNNYSLYTKIKNMAIKDELTKLYNRRFFEEQLSSEIERSIRHSTLLSLIMIDVDHFKNYNDKNGHIAGDTLLVTLSSLLKDACRVSDYVCRYGGEEFAIILPETDIHGAAEVGDKLRKRVHDNVFPFGDNQPMKKITISLGIASFPENAKDKLELKEKADWALYRSKRNGRNRITVYTDNFLE